MMQESARLPPLLSPSWTPTTIPSSVGEGHRGVGKRARATGILNGHHGRPRPSGHALQQNPQDTSHGSAPPPPPSSVSPHTQPPTRDVTKTQGASKGVSGVVSLSSSSTHPTNHSMGKDRWGGWLGGSLNSQKGRSEASRQNANSSPLQNWEARSSGFDMTKLYPELSAKLGLTKPSTNDNTSSPKNGISVREHLTSLTKVEHNVTDECRVKMVSPGHSVSTSYTKGLLATKFSNEVQSSKSSSVKSSKSKPKSGDRGHRRESHGSRSGGRPDSTSSGSLHVSSHRLTGRTPSKGPSSSSSSSYSRSTSSTSTIKNPSSGTNISSILEEQLRGGSSQRHPSSLSSSSSSIGTVQQLRLSQSVPLPKSTATVPSVTSGSGSFPGRSLVMAPATYPPSVAAHHPRVVTLLPRRLPPPVSSNTATLPEHLLRVHALREKHYAYNSDLFPLGIETSEESDGSDADDLCGSQQGWLDPMDDLNIHERMGQPSSVALSDPAGGTSCQRSITLAAALAMYRRQVAASRMRSGVRSREIERRKSLTQSLLEAARTHPRLTANACCHHRTSQSNPESPKLKSRFKSSVLVHRECVYKDGEGGRECGDPSLPGTRHCMRHIMYNVDQQLFTHCTARHTDNTLCRVPVFDMSHELPLCREHSKKKENVTRNTMQDTPKPKRSRKKNKMPILSRYGKRSKKRRRSSNSVCSVIPSTSVRPPMASQSSLLSSPQPSPTTPQTSPHFSAASCTDSVADAEDSELEEDMEGMVEGLDAASRLLDPRDLQDVLNRIPDHELTQLFDAPESKTGEYEGNAEVKEELSDEEHESEDSPHNIASSSAATATIIASSSTTTTATITSATPPLAEEGTTLSLDESTLNELVSGALPIDSIISSSFNQQELNTISQALSDIVQESNINLAGFDLNAAHSFPGSETGGSGAVGDVSDNSLMSQTSDGTPQTDYCEPGTPVSECKVNLLGQHPGLIVDAATLSPLK